MFLFFAIIFLCPVMGSNNCKLIEKVYFILVVSVLLSSFFVLKMRNINKWRKCFWRLGTFPLTSRVQHCFCSLWLLLALSFTHTGALRGNSRKLGGKFLSLFLFPPRPLLSFSYRRCLFGCDYTTTTLKWETHQNVKTKRKIHLTFNTENSKLIFQRLKKKKLNQPRYESQI